MVRGDYDHVNLNLTIPQFTAIPSIRTPSKTPTQFRTPLKSISNRSHVIHLNESTASVDTTGCSTGDDSAISLDATPKAKMCPNTESETINTLLKRIARLEEEKAQLKREVEARLDEQQVSARIASILSPVFTQNQIHKLTGKKKRVNWTHEELGKGLTLQYFSTPAYEYVTNELKIPLPRPRCLRDYASRMNMRQGFLEEVFHMMKVRAPTMTQRERVAVVLYDEFSSREMYEYDRKHDDVIGPHKKAQV